RPDGNLLSINEASALIERLLEGKKNMQEQEVDPRVGMIQGMLDGIPSGYYAVRPDTTVNYTFIRISRPKSGKLRGSIKVQTQHSDDLYLKAVRYPSGRLHVFQESIIEPLMLLLVGHR